MFKERREMMCLLRERVAALCLCPKMSLVLKLKLSDVSESGA